MHHGIDAGHRRDMGGEPNRQCRVEDGNIG